MGVSAVPTCAVIHAQLISVELPLLGNYVRNGGIYYNLIYRFPGILHYRPNPPKYCGFFIKIQFNQNK